MKLTRHNGRAGKNGVYNPKHNDRSFDIANSEHIDEERAKQNLYWDCYNGFRNFKNPEKENELSATFEDVEQLFYRQRYRDFVTRQNERNVKNRHPERNKETGDLLKSKKTCPEETVYQIGTLDNHVPPELLIEIVTEFMEIVNERFGSHVHILNWALHLDESTPHIHERHVFDCENQYGEIAPQQEKALEALGFELPEPEKPVGRKNNRKMTFDSACRVLLFDVAKKHGLQLEEEPEYGGCAYLEKQDYILFKQKEQLAAQEQKLEELTMKIEDVEALVDEVADIAYDKAVEVVADTVKLETHKEDIKLVEQSKAWVLSPERKASKKEVEYAVKRLDGVIARITNAMKSTIQKIQTTLMKPEVKKAGTEQIKKKAKSSIIEEIKSFLSRQKETYKIPYETHPADRKRQCVFGGSSNTLDFLPLDRTGNRRFVPVMVYPERAEVHILADEQASREYINQMWAEAMEIYRSGNFRLRFSPAMNAYLKAHQKDFMPEDTKAGQILDYLERYSGSIVCSKQLYKEALGHDYDEPKQWELREINDIMNNAVTGWRAFSNPRYFPEPYRRQKGWERIRNDNEPDNSMDGFQEIPTEEMEQLGLPEEWLKQK